MCFLLRRSVSEQPVNRAGFLVLRSENLEFGPKNVERSSQYEGLSGKTTGSEGSFVDGSSQLL